MILNFPPSFKLFGCNITPKWTDVPSGDLRNDNQAFDQMFLNWDWTGWIKPQIDFAVGECGCNVIRCIGSLSGVFAGTFTQNTYQTHWAQLIDYCKGLGVYVYFTGGWWAQVAPSNSTYNAGPGATMTDTQIYTGINNTLSSFSAAQNAWIIGIDAVQEANGWGPVGGVSSTATRCGNIYTGIKGGGTALPVTFSTYDVWTNASPGQSWISSISSSLDHLDFHYYNQSGYTNTGGFGLPQPIVLSDFNYWRSTYSGLDIIAGEFGDPVSHTYDVSSNFNGTILSCFNQGDIKVRGALMWAGSDGDIVTTDEWGMADASFATNRLKYTRVMRQFTGGSVAKAN